MIRRYTHPEMGRIWSDQRKYETWLQVEIAAAEAMAREGIVPEDAARDIRERSRFDIERIEATVGRGDGRRAGCRDPGVSETIGTTSGEPMTIARHLCIRGRVQGVGSFRRARYGALRSVSELSTS